jgi:hypothetical protein
LIKLKEGMYPKKLLREGRHNTLWVAAVELVLRIRVKNFN